MDAPEKLILDWNYLLMRWQWSGEEIRYVWMYLDYYGKAYERRRTESTQTPNA
jgi:hypothetical protein